MSTNPPESLKEKLRTLPHAPGVYLMRDRFGSILYVGKAKDLKRRVHSYFAPSRRAAAERPKIAAMMPLVHDVDITVVRNETEAILLEGRLIKHWRPKYNTDFTDDKRFPLVRLDAAKPLPQFAVCRVRRDDGARYFGPFAQAKALRQTLLEMRKRFGILLGDARPECLGGDRWRLYDDARAEIYGHPNELTRGDYLARLARAIAFLDTRARQWRGELREKMEKAAADQRFEEAARLRDLLRELETAFAPSRKFTDFVPAERHADALPAYLAHILKLPNPVRTMECFDISHISGSFTVASMVRFEDGAAVPKRYRRYKIKSFTGNDDFRSMREVVARRYRRLHESRLPFPDLVVIDGGAGQVSSALEAFATEGLTPPPLVGLAKKEEAIVFADTANPPLVLPRDDDALRLLQRLRDEAHRFANTFNADLRSRKIRESLLDEIPGLGAKRKAALLAHFGSIQALREAAEADIAAVPGFGAERARAVCAFFKRTRTLPAIVGDLRLPAPPLSPHTGESNKG